MFRYKCKHSPTDRTTVFTFDLSKTVWCECSAGSLVPIQFCQSATGIQRTHSLWFALPINSHHKLFPIISPLRPITGPIRPVIDFSFCDYITVPYIYIYGPAVLHLFHPP
jgi:hypothetical protein